MTLQKDNAVIIRIVKRAMLVGNFHLMEVILTGWKILSKFCKLLFLRHHCNISEQDFFNLVRDQIYKGKNVTLFYNMFKTRCQHPKWFSQFSTFRKLQKPHPKVPKQLSFNFLNDSPNDHFTILKLMFSLNQPNCSLWTFIISTISMHFICF